MTRVLFLTSWYPPHHSGGYELSCFDVMTRLEQRGHHVEVLCSDERVNGVADPETEHESRVHRRLQLYFRDGDLWSPSLRQRLAIERSNQRALDDALRSCRPDVVSVWQVGALSLGLLSALVERHLPIVYAVCDNWPTYAVKLDAWMRMFEGRRSLSRLVERLSGVPTSVPDLDRSGAFCFVSEFTRARSRERSPWRFPMSSVVYSGIDAGLFPGEDIGEPRPWRWRLLYVGRFDSRKGVDTLLRALPLMPQEATLVLYGRGSEADRARVRQLAGELHIDDRIEFCSSDRSALPAAYAAADVCVFPSEWQEPFGLVPLEAMACGTPVVATGVGGSAEFLVDGQNYTCFPAGDPSQLVAAVERLATDEALRAQLVRAGYETARFFDVEHLADTFEVWHAAGAHRFLGDLPEPRHPPFTKSVENGTSISAERIDNESRSAMKPLERHRAVAPGVLRRGQPDEIKGLYADLGRDWWEGYEDCLDDIPVLSFPETAPAIVQRFEGVTGRILDAGCGPNPAVSLDLAADSRRTVVALDIGRGTVRVAREYASRRGRHLLAVVGDVESLPFRPEAFDAVVCDDTIEHLPDDRAGVAELGRVLRSGGLAVLATPNRHSAGIVRNKLRDLLRGRRRPAPDYFVSNSHLREYTWREFEQLIGPDLRLRRRIPIGWAPRGWKSRLADRAVRYQPFHRFSQVIAVEAEPLVGADTRR